MNGIITPVIREEESIIRATTRLLLEDSANTMREYIEKNYDIDFKIVYKNGQVFVCPELIEKK